MGIYSREQTSSHALLKDYDTNRAYWEPYQTLYANIRASWESGQTQLNRAHTLLLTPAASSPAHMFMAANLAITAAKSNTPTILVDANFHSSVLQQRFSPVQGAGLRDLLADGSLVPANVASCLQQTFVPNLRLLPAGTPRSDEAALLLGSRFAEIVAILKDLATSENQPGLVVFHTPAVLAGADASVVSTLVDQTLLGIVSGRTTRKQAKDARAQLQRSHATLSGIVMLRR